MNQECVRAIFPPQFEPFQPYLSLPYIKGYLQANKVGCSCFDANIDFYWWLFNEYRSNLKLTSERNCYLSTNIETAINLMTLDKIAISDYRLAVNIIEEYLTAISPEEITIGLTSLIIGNKYSSDDVFNYISKENNIFKQYFTAAKSKILFEHNSDTYLFSLVVIDQFGAALSIAHEIKKHTSNSKIVFGGPFVSRYYDKLTNIYWLKDIVDALAPGEAESCLPNVLGFKEVYSGHVTPDFSDFDLRKYLSPHLVLPYLISHGCKWGKCVFCSHHLTYSKYRTADLNAVVDDLKALVNNHGAKYISFSDEYLSASQLSKLTNLLISNQIEIMWSSFAKAEPEFCKKEFTSSLYGGGARLLMFGFESTSQSVLDSMKKGTKASSYAAILQSCRESNIAVRLDFMIGFPGETSTDINNTFSFIKNNLEVIDTPFSSYVTAVFELREDTPIMSRLSTYNVKIKALLRGDLDEQYDFVNYSGVSPKIKHKWRNKIIGYSKTTSDFELITPKNKTHQLIYKDLFDKQKLVLPVTNISKKMYHELMSKWNHGVIFNLVSDDLIQILNYSSSCKILCLSSISVGTSIVPASNPFKLIIGIG